jgi:ribulose-5-phosphate 4-epimerase/fuculose-1-phosphate aldolase
MANTVDSSSRFPPEIKTEIQLLIRANHILHYHGLVDAFGHISIRHPLHDDRYIIAGYDPGAPALVSSASDFLEYYVETSEPLKEDQPKGYKERYIHGEIFKAYPEVQCVVHSHSEAVIPFTATKTPLKPVFHMAGFLTADGPPTYDITNLYEIDKTRTYTNDMLISANHMGSHLAGAFRCDSTYQHKERKIPGWERIHLLPVVLQHKHGFTSIGTSIQNAVYYAVYTHKNAIMLKNALDVAGGKLEDVATLTREEAWDCAVMNAMTEDKAFRLWLREVQTHPLYQNTEGEPTNLPVKGLT